MRRKEDILDKLDEKERSCDFSLHRVSRFIQPSLLLFLSRGQSYGYELIDKLKRLGFHEESIDVGAVYRNLRKLEKEGFVESTWYMKGARKKRVYKITPQGRALLRIWVERVKERKKALDKFISLCQGGDL